MKRALGGVVFFAVMVAVVMGYFAATPQQATAQSCGPLIGGGGCECRMVCADGQKIGVQCKEGGCKQNCQCSPALTPGGLCFKISYYNTCTNRLVVQKHCCLPGPCTCGYDGDIGGIC